MKNLRRFPSKSKGIEWLKSHEVTKRLGISDLILANSIWNDDLVCYYISGKWLHKYLEAPTDLRGKVRSGPKGWTWVDGMITKQRSLDVDTITDQDINFSDLLDNLDDLAFSIEDVVEFEKKHGLIAESETFKHSQDFRSINKNGKKFTLTPKQTQVIQILFKAQERKTPEMSQPYIIEEVSPDTSTRRVRDLFKNNIAAWKALIEQGSKKGTIRLKR